MKIRTRLTLSMSLMAGAVLISVAAVAYSLANVQTAMEQTTAAALAGRRVMELTQLTAELEFGQEARPREQWVQVQRELTAAIERLAALPAGSRDSALQQRLRHNNENARQLFDRWVAEDGAKVTRLLADSMMIRLRAMEAVTQRLVQDRRHAVSRQMTQLIAVMALCICLIGGSGILIVFVNRRMVRSLDLLRRAIGDIAEGKERIAVPLSGTDEFARLGATLGDMSHRLADARKALTEANGRMAAEVATRRMAEHQLRLAIDSMESAFAYFDADDRLVVCNDRFIDPGTRENIGDPIGRTFEEILRAFAQASFTAVEALADRDAWFRWRLDLHRNPHDKAVEMQWTDGTWSAVSERRTSDGGTVCLWTDITAQKARQAELEYSQDQL